jgi:endonuclease/exonuclease/phosphatase family metal-dependent hydrolase
LDPLQDTPFGRAAAFVWRHRWGALTLAAAAFVWGAGAVATPAPAVVGGALAGVAALAACALRRFLRRRRHSAASERLRTRVSVALYATSLALAAVFLGGLFLAPQATLVVEIPGSGPRLASSAPALASWGPALVSAHALSAVDRVGTRLPALYELGSRLPLFGMDRRAGAAGPSPTGGQASRVVPALASPQTLRVLSFNVWHGYPGPGAREERYARIRELIVETEPDLVLLQESWATRRFGRLAERLGTELGFGHAYARANGSLRYLGFEEGLAILSRHPLSGVRRVSLGPRTPAWEMRAALGAVVTLPGGEELEVWNTHLSHSSAVGREGQAHSLASVLADTRVALLAGDMNAGVASPALAAFRSVALHPLLSDGIDHVLGSPALLDAWTIVDRDAVRFGRVPLANGVSRPEVSDHPALLVELQRKRAPTWRKANARDAVAAPGGRRHAATFEGSARPADPGAVASTLAVGLRSVPRSR